MPLPLTVSCFSKIQIGFTFLVPSHPGSPGYRAFKRVCVSVCIWLYNTGLCSQCIVVTADACMLSCCPGSDWSAHIQVAARCLPVQADSAAARVWSGSSPRRPTPVPYISVCYAHVSVASVLDSSAVGPGFKSQPRRCQVTVLGKLFTPIVPLFSVHQAAKLVSSPLKGCEGNCSLAKVMAAYRRVYDSRHLQANCQEPWSAPEPYTRQSSMGYLYLLCPCQCPVL